MRINLFSAALAATLALSACGGNSDDEASSETGSQPSAAASAPADVAAATEEIKKNWSDFYDPAVPPARKREILQDSASVEQLMAAGEKSAIAKDTASVVKSVTFKSATEATVAYDILIFKNPVLSRDDGTMVLDGGMWKITKDSFCTLQKLQAQGKPLPGCP